MNEELKLILGENLIIGNEQIPIAHLRYKGKSKKYVTWTITGEAPALSANDEDLCSICNKIHVLFFVTTNDIGIPFL